MKFSGHDGISADHPEGQIAKIAKSPVMAKQGTTMIGSAMARCGECGTSVPLSGRPGTAIKEFTCRSCKAVCVANDGRGYTFECRN